MVNTFNEWWIFMKPKKSFVIAISGGSGSGKTTIVNLFVKYLTHEKVVVVSQDHYYRDLSHMLEHERKNINFDEPTALDDDLLIMHIRELLKGKEIKRPCYDFTTHCRKTKTELVRPAKIIIFDGLFSLCFSQLRPLLDLKLYVDVPQDIRFIRRLERDILERGRSMTSVVEQYLKTVRPMHSKHIEPCRRYADFVLPWLDYNHKLIKSLCSQIIS